MVPLRVITENIGGYVLWQDNVITVTKGDIKVSLTENNTTALKNGAKFTLDAKPYVGARQIYADLQR